MAEQLKQIVHALNGPPFNRKFNLISFDSLDNLNLLQELSDVIQTIQGGGLIDIRDEAADQTAIRLFTALKIIKFPQPTDPEHLGMFREGLVAGEKESVYPVLEWILSRVPELEQRAYLAKFLVKVHVPPEFAQDLEVQDLMHENENLMDTFKTLHKESSMIKAEGMGTEEIRQDLSSMEQERDQLTRRVDKLRRKMEAAPNKEKMLELAARIRADTEREADLGRQKQEQRNALVHAEQRIQRLESLKKEIQQKVETTRPDDIIKKLQEENSVQAYMVTEKLPKDIATKRKAVQELQKVLAQPAIDKTDIDSIKKRINDVNEQINQLVEKRNVEHDPRDDKLAIFRQQASIVQRKKEAAAEKLQDAKNELQRLETQVKEKKAQMKDPEGNEIVTSVQFKNYVNKLRSKTNMYKKKRTELQDLRAEIGVLSRTEEILKAQIDQLSKRMKAMGEEMEDEDVDEGFGESETTAVRPRTAKLDGMDKRELENMIRDFNGRIDIRKREMAPVLQELRALRDQYQQLSDEYTAKKNQYDTQAASLESTFSRLEHNVKSMRNDLNNAESNHFKLMTEEKLLQAWAQRAQEENDGKRVRDQIQKLIQTAEDAGKTLREGQKSVQGDQQDAARQMKLWRDVMRFAECKKQCWNKAHPQTQNNDRWSAGSGRGMDPQKTPPSRSGSAKQSSRPGSGSVIF